jgi:diguanylate cyclase (GGDEF)-like protein
MPVIHQEQDAIRMAKCILSSIQDEWCLGRDSFKTTSSIGLAFYPANGTKERELLLRADEALYQAKKDGKNRYRAKLI